MRITDRCLKINLPKSPKSLLAYLDDAVQRALGTEESPVRFVITRTDYHAYHCEVAAIAQSGHERPVLPSIFEFRRRQYENNQQFNAVMVIPTGIDCDIGGHAGDATPAARLLASVCDHLIIHPNVVNASDVSELTDNCLVVEGSILSRLLMGTAGLQKVRANRLLVVLEEMDNLAITQAAMNAVSGARATLGIHCSEVICLRQPCTATIHFTESGRASGTITGMEPLIRVLMDHADDYDAVAIVTVLETEQSHERALYDYFVNNTINLWGGIEAMFSHTLSMLLNKPSMHAPMPVSDAPLNFGVVDPRKACEVVSRTYLHCVLKGLHRSPKIVSDPSLFGSTDILSAKDIHCLVIPEGALGLPTLAALEQGIPVIAVRENHNLMRNNLERLAFAAGKYFLVENYLEAAGLLAAFKAGIAPSSIRRPIPNTLIRELGTGVKAALGG